MKTSDLPLSLISTVDDYARVKSAVQNRISRLKYHQTAVKTLFLEQNVQDSLDELKNLLHLLDINYIITTTEFFKKFGTTEEHMKKLFGKSYKLKKNSKPNSRLEQIISKHLESLSEASRKSRVQDLLLRLDEELQLAYHNNSYVIFNTLTANDSTIESAFTDPKYWNSYLRNWTRNTINHKHFAVLEEGGKNGRTHIHVIHIFDSHKKDLLDPNLKVSIPTNRIITSLKSAWTCGFSAPLAVRLSPNDRWGNDGHRWPVIKKGTTFVPIEAKPTIALARYISKYLLKAYTSEGTSLWRTRLSRKFGKSLAQKTAKKLKTKTLRLLMTNPNLIQVVNKQRLPISTKSFLITIAKEWTNRMKKKSMYPNLLRALRPQPSIKQRLTNLMQKTPESSLQNFGCIPTPTLLNMVASDLSNSISSVLKKNIPFIYIPQCNGAISL